MTGTIGRLIKQSKPFDSVEQEVMLSIQRISAQILEPLAALLKETGNISVSQYNVLRILRGAHPSRLPCSEISNRMVARDPDVTRLVDRLADRGLVDRERHKTDRRVVEVGITKQGLALLKKLDAGVEEHPKTMLGHIGEAKLEQLRDLLEALLAGPSTSPRAKSAR